MFETFLEKAAEPLSVLVLIASIPFFLAFYFESLFHTNPQPDDEHLAMVQDDIFVRIAKYIRKKLT